MVRVKAALMRAEGMDSPFGWMLAADYEYPPLLHWLAIPLGDAVGRSAGTVERFGLLWLVLLSLATAAVAHSLSRDRWTAALAGGIVAMVPANTAPC